MATVRIDDQTHRILHDLAGDRPLNAVIREAAEDLQRKRFFEQFNAAYSALRQDPEAWNQEQHERAEWEATLRDGLEDESA